MDEEIQLENMDSKEFCNVQLSQVSLFDKVISFFPTVFKKDKTSSEDMEMLTSTPDTTMELEYPQPFEDTKLLASEPEDIMELALEAPETSEDKETWEQTSVNSLSDKFKDFFNLNKKFENLTIKKVVNTHTFIKCKTLDELNVGDEDFFIENYQYFEDLPYLEVQREQNHSNIDENREAENLDTVDGQCKSQYSLKLNSGWITENGANFHSSYNAKDNENESKEEKLCNESMKKDEVKEDSKNNVDRKKIVKKVYTDGEEKRKSLKNSLSMEINNLSLESNSLSMISGTSGMESGTSGMESGTSGMESGTSGMESGTSGMESCFSGMESITSSMESGTSSMESGTSSMESDNSNMEHRDINSDEEGNRLSILQVAKNITTLLLKAVTNSYTDDSRKF